MSSVQEARKTLAKIKKALYRPWWWPWPYENRWFPRPTAVEIRANVEALDKALVALDEAWKAYQEALHRERGVSNE